MERGGDDGGVNNRAVDGKSILEQGQPGDKDNKTDNAQQPQFPASNQTPSGDNKCRPRRYCRVRFEWPKIVLEIVTVLLVAYYACQAERQATAAHDTANAAITANAIAHENAVSDLRAYVSVGQINAVQKKNAITSGRVQFVNAGRTPARHFSALMWSSVKTQGPSMRFLSRFKDFATGMISGGGGIGGMEGTLGSGVSVVKELRKEWLPSPTLVHQLKDSKTNSILIIYGMFEYCDVFGNHRCDSFSYEYNVADNSWSPFGRPPCPSDDLVDPPPMAILMGKPEHLREISRCEQPTEKPYNEQ
jgi:hypothetical protein